MENWTRFKCILTKNIFLIVDLLDYCNYLDVFKYRLLYSENDFKHWDILLVKVKRCNLIERNLWQIQPIVVVKICLYFASLSIYLLCLASHNANQFLPLLFQRKELQMFIFLLLSCKLYLRCSVRNLLTGRSKSIKKYMKEYFQKLRLVFGKMCKKNYVGNDIILSYRVFCVLASETLISTNTVF